MRATTNTQTHSGHTQARGAEAADAGRNAAMKMTMAVSPLTGFNRMIVFPSDVIVYIGVAIDTNLTVSGSLSPS